MVSKRLADKDKARVLTFTLYVGLGFFGPGSSVAFGSLGNLPSLLRRLGRWSVERVLRCPPLAVPSSRFPDTGAWCLPFGKFGRFLDRVEQWMMFGLGILQGMIKRFDAAHFRLPQGCRNCGILENPASCNWTLWVKCMVSPLVAKVCSWTVLEACSYLLTKQIQAVVAGEV